MKTMAWMFLLGTLAGCGPCVRRDTKLGWMDDARYTERDQRRVRQLSGQTHDSDSSVIAAIQSGTRGSVTRQDFELMRQDRRRAQAAYPDAASGDLFTGGWVTVDMSAKIPAEFCTSGNNNATEGDNGEWYLDGGCYVSFVNSKYPKRADAATTAAYFTALKAQKKLDKLAALKRDGPKTWWVGSGGSMIVRLDKTSNMVVVIRAQEWASQGTEYRIPFVPEEWVDIRIGDIEAIKKIPSFANATQRLVDVEPTGAVLGFGTESPQQPPMHPSYQP